MIKHLLDTNILIYTIKNRPPMVREVFNHHYRQLAISSITVGELVYLVSNNTKEFERVNGLRLENWVVLQ